MRVKLCARCPYTPRDLTGHYDPEAALHACAKCDGEQGLPARHFPRQVYRRQKCSIMPNITGTAQRSVARSATENSVSSGTTAGEPPSVQGSVLIASRPVRTAIADGYAGFKPPDERLRNHEEKPEPSVSSLMPAAVEEEPI